MPWSPRSRRVQDETILSPRLRSNEESAEVDSRAGDRLTTSAERHRGEVLQNVNNNASDIDRLESGLSGSLAAENSTQVPLSSLGIIGLPAPLSALARPVAAPDAADISGGTRLEMRSPTLDVPSSGSMPALGSNLGGNEALGAMLPDAPAAQSLPIADQDTTPNGIRSDSHHGQNTTSGIPTQNEEAAAVDVSSLQVGNSTPTSNSPASSPLPLHLAGLPAAEREALQRRRAHELAVDEARAQEPRRRIGRSALQLYAAATGTLAFLALLLVKDSEEEDEVDEGTTQHPKAEAPLRWVVVLAPLAAQYLALALLTALDIRDAYTTWAFLRQSLVPGMEIAARHQILAKTHETLWHFACTASAFLLALYLEAHGNNSSSSSDSSSSSGSDSPSFVNDDIVSTGFGTGSFGDSSSSSDEPSSSSSSGLTLVEAFGPIWFYGAVSVVLGLGYIMHWWAYALETKRLMSSLGGVGFALMARVLPIALIVDKVLGRPTPWPLVFLPLWTSVGALALVGTCVSCMVPVLVLTQDEAGLLLGWIVGVAALFLLIPAVCTLTFLALLCRYLDESEKDDNSSEDGEDLSLAGVLTPLFVMYGLLACLTPLLMRVITSTHQTLDAMNAHPLHAPPGADGTNAGAGGHTHGSRSNGSIPKRPGIERDWPDVSLAPLFAQQTSTLFRKLGPAAGEVQRRALIAAAAATAAAAGPPNTTMNAGEGTHATADSSGGSASAVANADASNSAASSDAASGEASVSNHNRNATRGTAVGMTTRPHAPTTAPPSAQGNESLLSSPNSVSASSGQSDSAAHVEMTAYSSRRRSDVEDAEGAAAAALRADKRSTPATIISVDGTDLLSESTVKATTNAGDEAKSNDDDEPFTPLSPTPDTPSSSSSSYSSAEAQCFVCCERQRDAVVQPCGHGGMCYQCAVAFVSAPVHGRRWHADSSQDDPPKCPLCRAPVVEVLRLTPLKGFGGTFVANASWTLLSNSPTSAGASSSSWQGPRLNGPQPLGPPPGGGGGGGGDDTGGLGPLLSVRPAPLDEHGAPTTSSTGAAAAGAAGGGAAAAATTGPSTTTTTTTTTFFLRRHSDTQELGGDGSLLEEEAAAAAAAAAQEMNRLGYDVLDLGRDQQSHDNRARSYGRSSSSSSASSEEGTVLTGVDVEAGRGAALGDDEDAYFAASEISASDSDVSTPRSDVSGVRTPVFGPLESDEAALDRMRRVDLELGMNDEN